MSHKLFNKKEIKPLIASPFVKNISEKGITYTDEFKRIFIAEYEKGKLPRQIFEECGFDVESLGMDRMHSATKRWRSAYRRD
ncbi:transposase [Paenibacillus glacialis]|uniref:Transposase n=1 Tax=Paenibacillus glacialis TaxID=494026 RepID=A0A162Q1J5_9BACL|nr:transposase [Paenibacillus glacialis]